MATLSPTPVYEYLKSLIGSPNAWRTADELAREMGNGDREARDQVSKALWYLNKHAMITRRLRGGTGLHESMAVVADASVRKTTSRRAPDRVAIATPVSGPVALRVEAVPAPVLPEPGPEAREVVEKLVRSPTPALTLADVLAKHKARVEVEAEPEPAPEQVDGDADDAPDPVVEPDGEKPDDPLDIELANVMEALQAPRRVPVHIHDLDKKLNVLSSIALFLPPMTRRLVNGVVKDLERVHGS